MKKKIAEMIRVISIPPVMISALIIILYIARPDIFLTHLDLVMALVCLALFPALAYPLSALIPALKGKKREGQRNLALVLTGLGYSAAFVYGLISRCSNQLLLIFFAYFLSVVLLLFFNKVVKLRASGHACSITGPIFFAYYFLGGKAIIACIALYIMILWASLTLKRHTLKEFILGSLTSMVSFAVSVLILF